MFKVECPRCKAPYQVDERRVPPTGLKMRCPKCGTSFQVEPPPADPRDTGPNAVIGGALGIDPAASEAGKPPLPRKKPAMRGTMIGVAPPLARGGPPTAEKSFGHAATEPAFPASRPIAPEVPDELDLPAVVDKSASSTDPFGEVDLPALARAEPPRAGAAVPPRPMGKPPLPAGKPTTPAIKPPLPAGKPTTPAVKPPLPGAKPAAPAAKTGPLAPAPAPTSAFDDELDLPIPAALSGRTVPGFASPGRFSDRAPGVQEPAPAILDLPSPAQPRAAHAAADPSEIELDLPSLSSGIDLPSPSFGADLPSPSAAVGLPSPAMPRGVDTQPGMRAFGDIDLPIISADLPSPSAGLPSPIAAGLPSPSAGLPALAGGLPALAGSLPIPVGAGLPSLTDDPFGLSQPRGRGAVASSPPDAFGSLPEDPFGASSADPFADASGDVADPFGAPASLPPDDAFGAAPRDVDPFGPSDDDPFANALPPPSMRRPTPDPFAGALPADHHDADEFAPPGEAHGASLVRQGGGGVAYGEVNLDDGDAGSGVAIEGDVPEPAEAPPGAEFVGLPTEGAPGPRSVPSKRLPGTPVVGGAVQEIQEKKRRTRLRVVLAGVVVATLAGGSLTLVPALGPFGAYFVVDQLKKGDYQQALAHAEETARSDLSHDTFPDAERARSIVLAAASGSPRYKPLSAYGAYVGFLQGLRFGQEPDVYAQGKVALEELSEANDVDKVELARATKAAADGQLARARDALSRLAAKAPNDVDVAVARGEVELRARDANAAVAAWTAAGKLENGARSLFGLARAKVVAGDVPGAEKLAAQVLAANPRHVGARLLLAKTKWTTNRDETAATKYLGEVLAASADAGPEERIEAETFLGEIDLNRGRVSQAEEAFGEAVKIADKVKASAKGARALSGLGEALFRAARYSQAIARFKAAAQADADYVPAQVGVAKSSLELERLGEAKDMLVKLKKSYPNEMQVAYWYGRVEEALGDRKEAEAAYRDAIASGKDDPETVQAYIALASVLSQVGELDAASTTLADAQKHLPASPALYKALGKVAMTQGRYADGLAAFQRALELHTDDVESKFLVGTALTRQHQFDQALATFDDVAKIDRDFPGLALERGILFQESGRTEEALREYESALAKAPNDPDLMLKVGCGKAEAGDGVEAEKLLRKVLEQRQGSAETHYCLGRSLMARHNLNDALKEFEQALQIDPNHAEYYLYVGWAANDSGNLARATTALKKALDLDQGLADAYWQRGILRIRETRAKDAVDDLNKALSLRPSRYEAHADLALAYYDLGKEDLARAEWLKAITAKPDDAEWHFHYGKLLNLHLDNAAAATELKKAIDLSTAAGDSPPWLSEAHRLAALSLGPQPAAIPHWQAFLKLGAANSPYREEAKAALKRLGATYNDD